MAPKTKSSTKTKAAPRKKTSAARKEAPVVNSRQKKTAFPIGTWVTVVLLAALIGFTFYLNRQKETAAVEATPTAGTTYVFDVANGAASSIEIKPAIGDAVSIARNEKNEWVVKLPLEAEADQGLAEAAASQLSALQVVSPVEGKAEIFGLENPAYTITLEFANGQKHTLEVGDSTPTNSGYYARVDKDKMIVTNLSGIDALLQLVFSPPYLNTPTPTLPPATNTPVPPTQESTVTPTP